MRRALRRADLREIRRFRPGYVRIWRACLFYSVSHRNEVENITHTGIGVLAALPVGRSLPVDASMWKLTRLFEPTLATTRKLPLGSMLKLRGVSPCVDSNPVRLCRPESGSMVNMAMLLCPRFELYRNRPDGCTTICAPELWPTKSSGRVRTVSMM